MKILLVDSSSTFADELTPILASFDYKVMLATNGQNAVNLFRSESPDLILMEIGMSAMAGIEAVSEIRKIESTQDMAWTPILLLTSNDSPENMGIAIQAGGDDFVSRSAHAHVLQAKITALSRISTMLRQTKTSKNMLEHILESVSDGVHVLDLNGIILAENAASMTMLGWGTDYSLIGKHAHSTMHHHHADQSEYLKEDCPIYATLHDGKVRYIKDDVFWRHDNTCFPVEYKAAPLLDNQGKIYGVTVVFQDITERKETLKQIRETNLTLEKRVAERTEELESALQRLRESQQELVHSEANATLSTLIASISHELGTPIGNSNLAASSMTTQARELQEKIDSGAIKRSDFNSFLVSLNEGTEMIARNLNRAHELLKNFHQVTADQASEQRRQFDLAIVVQEIIFVLTPSLKRQPHQIKMEIPPGIIMDSQPGSLGQIVINLVNNAYLHAFENLTDGLLTISAEVMGNKVKLSFADNGIGIPKENLAKLFEPFFSTKIGEGGTGLGMAIVENLVKKTLGGEITVHSTVEVGTRFDILLPLVMDS